MTQKVHVLPNLKAYNIKMLLANSPHVEPIAYAILDSVC